MTGGRERQGAERTKDWRERKSVIKERITIRKEGRKNEIRTRNKKEGNT